jgi:hypothetical protein
MVILTIQPTWVQIPITFTRYVLPTIPFILLAAAMGLFNVFHFTSKLIKNTRIHSSFMAATLLLLIYAITSQSPLLELIKKPNSNTLHSLFTIDFRNGPNKFKDYMNAREVSSFWITLKNSPSNHKIAVAPWFFESYDWDAPRWEKLSNHYVVPGMLLGLCIDERLGEIPLNSQFNFRNLAYLLDKNDLENKNIHWIVYQKPERFKSEVNNKNLKSCQQSLQGLYGKPYYEDKLIVVYQI